MNHRILYLFTRTPLHVGAGASVGAIDQPIQRERHTGFPIIPATGQKGSFADQWPDLVEDKGKPARVKILRDKDQQPIKDKDGNNQFDGDPAQAAWLFGSDTTDISFAGSLIFSEARVLAFPIRSAKGSYAWITCPLMLQRAARDGVFGPERIRDEHGAEKDNAIRKAAQDFKEPPDDEAVFQRLDAKDTNRGKLDLGGQIVLEEYCFKGSTTTYPSDLSKAVSELISDDLFKTAADRLVILSNGMMSHFATTACEIAQHVRISDETGTADPGGLFNQENVPADTLFYAVLSATKSRVPDGKLKYLAASGENKAANDEAAALTAFETKVKEVQVFQFGGDATTGLGFCTVTLNEIKGA